MARITGLATGMDMDQIIKDSMRPYRIKIQKVQQQNDVVELKQKLYRDIIEDSRKFYNKYFDITSKDSLLLTSSYSNTKFESKNSSVATATGGSSAINDNYKIKVDKLATSTIQSFTLDDLKGQEAIQFKYNGKEVNIELTDIKDDKELAKVLSKELDSIGLKANFSEFTNQVSVETKQTGSKIGENENDFEVFIGSIDKTDSEKPQFVEAVKFGSTTKGTDLEATITNSKGQTIKYGSNLGDRVSSSNSVVIDGVTFTLSSVGETEIVGKSDVTEIKDKIVNFVNDYNTLMEKLNKLTLEKPAKGYAPLTDEQKKEMSEDEIKLWNSKVEQGQLSRDNDLSRIARNMKSAMSTLVSGTGLTLESIGIKPVADYSGTKNGTFTIDEDKLSAALENNLNDVMNLFTQNAQADVTDSEKFGQQGIMQRLKTILYDETITVSAPLIQKAGVKDSATFTNNTMTKQMEKYSKKIQDMEKDFKRREQQLYSKWAIVEKTMNSYNSQQSYLMSQLG